MADTYARRAAADYAQAFADLFPTGPAWSREPDAALMLLLSGLSGIWERVDARAADLRERETDPRRTVEMLPDWERALGLPDSCLSEPLTIEDRQRALVERLTLEGGQSPAFFIGLAAAIGYDIDIYEHAPFMAGISEAGDTRRPGAPSQWFRWEVGPASMRAVWTVLVKNARLSWFRAASGEAGIDPHLTVGIASDLECLMRRFGPAHAEIYFDYSGVAGNEALAGTP